MPGGQGGTFETGIDLTRIGDVLLLYRAIANRWPISDASREAIGAQIGPALDHWIAQIETGYRGAMQFIKFGKLMQAMQAVNLMCVWPQMRTAPGMPRRRHPEKKRRPRWKRIWRLNPVARATLNHAVLGAERAREIEHISNGADHGPTA